VKSKTNYSHIRITLDRKNDLKLLRHLVKAIKPRPILLNHIIHYYKKNPKIFEINKKYHDDEGLLKSLKIDQNFLKAYRKNCKKN